MATPVYIVGQGIYRGEKVVVNKIITTVGQESGSSCNVPLLSTNYGTEPRVGFEVANTVSFTMCLLERQGGWPLDTKIRARLKGEELDTTDFTDKGIKIRRYLIENGDDIVVFFEKPDGARNDDLGYLEVRRGGKK